MTNQTIYSHIDIFAYRIFQIICYLQIVAFITAEIEAPYLYRQNHKDDKRTRHAYIIILILIHN